MRAASQAANCTCFLRASSRIHRLSVGRRMIVRHRRCIHRRSLSRQCLRLGNLAECEHARETEQIGLLRCQLRRGVAQVDVKRTKRVGELSNGDILCTKAAAGKSSNKRA